MFNASYIAEIYLHKGKTEWPVFLQDGKTPLHKAARSGSRPVVELLLEKRVNAGVRDKVW